MNQDLIQSLVRCKYVYPTSIQETVITNTIVRRHNILAASKTGSGKSLAFIIPILNSIYNNKGEKKNIALILVPTRELGKQLNNLIVSITESKMYLILERYKCATLIGGESEPKQVRLLTKEPHIIIATPGR